MSPDFRVILDLFLVWRHHVFLFYFRSPDKHITSVSYHFVLIIFILPLFQNLEDKKTLATRHFFPRLSASWLALPSSLIGLCDVNFSYNWLML